MIWVFALEISVYTLDSFIFQLIKKKKILVRSQNKLV